MSWLLWSLGAALALAGLFLLARASFWDRARGRLRCPKCWYDMAGTAPGASPRCPECGREAGDERDLKRTRRHWRTASFGLILALLGLGAGLTPTIRRDPLSLVPTPVLVLTLSFYDDAAERVYQRSRNKLWMQPPTTTRWERLLIARHLARQLDRAPAPQAGLGSTPVRGLGLSAALAAWRADTRFALLTEVALLGADGRPAVPALVRALADPNPLIRTEAARTLARLGQRSRAAVRAIARIIADQAADIDLRLVALESLDTFGPNASLAIPAVLDLLARHDSPLVRASCALSLGAIARDQPRVIEALAGETTHPDMTVRAAAADALGRLGPPARSALPALRRLASDPQAFVAARARAAIDRIAPFTRTR